MVKQDGLSWEGNQSNRSLKQLITSQSGCREQDITTLFSIDTAQHPLPKEQYYLLWTGLSPSYP